MQNQELMEYISGIIKSVCRFSSLKIEGAMVNSSLVFVIDDSLMYQIDLTGKVNNTSIAFIASPVISQNEYGIIVEDVKLVPTTNMDVYMRTFYRWYSRFYEYIDSFTKVFEDPTILDDSDFSSKSIIKASDGCDFYNAKTLDGVISIPVFSGLPLLTKGDKLALEILTEKLDTNILNLFATNYNYPKEYIVHYSIFKKKINTVCNIYFKILNLNRPLKC